MAKKVHDPLIDVSAVARGMLVSGETVRSWIRAGKLDAIQTPNGHYRVPLSAYHACRERRAAKKLQDAQDAQELQKMQKSQAKRRKHSH